MLSFGRKNRKNLLGLDISSSSVKLIELSLQNGRYCIEHYGSEPLPPNAVAEKNIVSAEGVGDAIEKLIRRVRPGTALAAVAVSGSTVITKVIDMDTNMTDDERENQIRLDADAHIPYPLSEVNLDFDVIGKSLTDPNRVRVLIAASRSENIEQRVEALGYAGLEVKVVDIEAHAVERAFGLIEAAVPDLGNMVAIFDIGHSITTLYVLQNGNMIYNREQTFGGKVLTDNIQRRYGLTEEDAMRAKKSGGLPDDYASEILAPFMDSIVQEAARALQVFYSASQFNDVDHILLAGGTAVLPGLPYMVQSKLGNVTSVADPFVNMQVAPNVDRAALQEDAPRLMVACGLALRSFD